MTLAPPTPEAFAVIDALREQGGTVATAESLTGGLLCATLVGVPGASDVVRGGVVAYAADLKASLLGVPQELVDEVGTVADQTAAAMAQGVRERLGARYGLATTGVAGPTPSRASRSGSCSWRSPVQTTSTYAGCSCREIVRRSAPVRVRPRSDYSSGS